MNRNKKGFTLVELIVVMCLMGIIMAAVMALVAPTSKYYYKVQTTKDQENCALSVGKAINNELQYALAVEVYSSDVESVSPTDPSKFTNYIKIDNVTARSSSKKHATGIVYKGTTATHSESVVMGEATYEENAFKITLSEYNNQKGNNFIMLDFESNPMKYEGGSYVKNTDVKYNSSLSVNFSNINSSLTMGVSRADSISVSYDASKTDYIFIYYQPAQNGATATTTTTSLTTTTTTTPTTTTAPDDSGSTTTTTTTTTTSTTLGTTTTTSGTPADVSSLSIVQNGNPNNWGHRGQYNYVITNDGAAAFDGTYTITFTCNSIVTNLDNVAGDGTYYPFTTKSKTFKDNQITLVIEGKLNAKESKNISIQFTCEGDFGVSSVSIS